LNSIKNNLDQGIKDLRFSPHKKSLLAACDDDGTVIVWDTTKNINESVHVMFHQQHTAPASALAFSPLNITLFASAGMDRKIYFYSVMEKKCDC
jgi:protein NEDD1